MTDSEMSTFAKTVLGNKYLRGDEKTWDDVAQRVAEAVVGPYFPDKVAAIAAAISNREFLPGGRQLANAGHSNFLNNCFLYRVEDSKEGIADFFRKGMVTGMTGGGVGAVWTDLRPRGASVKNNGKSTGPCAFMQGFNEVGRAVVNGGGRRMAIWAGLHWYHPDVLEFMELKDWDERTVEAKNENFSAFAPMDMTNISVILDDEFFEAMEDPKFHKIYKWVNEKAEVVAAHEVTHAWAKKVYDIAVQKMLQTGEPGFSVDLGENKYENLRNPCCEITSEDDSDVCCLGSINLARIETPARMREVTELGTLFLLCSTLVSEVPHKEVLKTRMVNRRLGLGVMGVYEWLVARGYRYEPNNELGEWLEIWEKESDDAAFYYAMLLNITIPVKKRAVAPTGTIGIIAETTTGIEPLFAVAFKRRYIDESVWKYQYVIDATAQRLIEKHDLEPDELETAYDLAFDPARRLAMQAFVQQYTDHAISSTINLPRFEEQPFTAEEFGKVLYDYLPSIRGITAYPDGARGGQPLNVVDYAEAAEFEGLEFEEIGLDQSCVNGVCGI
jgi:ribonucleoside-diphosphate reductase alpha chain